MIADKNEDMNFLDRNEFNFQPSQEVIEACKSFNPLDLCFYTRIYDEGKKSIFSVALSERYNVAESQVILGYGAEDILKQAVHYYLGKAQGGRLMMVPAYSWWYYKSLASEVEGETIEYPLYENGNTFSYDIDALIEMSKRERPALLFVASPNNPTGNGLDDREIRRLMDGVARDVVVVIDEAYALFASKDNSYISSLIDDYPNLIIVRTMSKFYGLPGLRMGFGFISKELEDFGRYANKYLGYNRFSEPVAIAALESEAHYRDVAKRMNDGFMRYKEELGKLEGWKVFDSVANFVLVRYPVALRDKLKESFAGVDYKIKFLNDAGLEDCLRITLGREEQNEEVISTILSCIK